MAIFNQRYSGPDDQAVRDGKSVDAGTTGPYAPANSDPAAYKNPSISAFKKSPLSSQFYSQAYSAKDAQAAQKGFNTLTNEPAFPNPGDQALAKDFLFKYIQGGDRGLVPQDEMITKETISAFQSQQPGQGIGDSNVTAASRIKYPGATGTQVS